MMSSQKTRAPETDDAGNLYPAWIQSWLTHWRDPRPMIRALHRHTATLEAAQAEFPELIKNITAGYGSVTISVGSLPHMNDVVPLLRWLATKGYTQRRDPDNCGNYCRTWYLGEIRVEVKFPTEGQDAASDDVCRFVECGVYSGKEYKLVCPGETLDEAKNKRIDD
jgi:hypothetical protein